MNASSMMITDLASVAPCDTIQDAVDAIEAAGTSSVPVVDKKQRLVGILSERDVIAAALPEYIQMLHDAGFMPNLHGLTKGLKRIAGHPVEKYMSREVITVHDDEQDLQVAALMLRHKLRLPPVVDDDGKLIGIIRRVDLFKHVL